MRREVMMEENRTVLRISVRNLVEFILRSGDIDNRKSKATPKDAMQEGSRMHRKIQKREGSDYHAEVPLIFRMESERYDVSIEGRADGIIINDQGVTIDEIKGIYQDTDTLLEPYQVHLAQAKCYAFIYGTTHDLEKIQVQMTYCNLDTEQIRYFHSDYTLTELHTWFYWLIGQYRKWMDFQYDWKQTRKSEIAELEFPFDYRQGQKKLVADVYRTIQRKKTLFIQAPTGVGKTISTVFPAVKAMGVGLTEKIFYLTAKTITRSVAEDTFTILEERDCGLKRVTLTAKEKLCLCEEMKCNPVECPYAKGHFDRVNEAVFDLVTNHSVMDREVITNQALMYQVCPFEMMLDATLWCDVVICDYNYVYDPNVYLKRFFEDGMKGDYIFLVDEAHNLVERGRQMYSASLYKEDFLLVKKIVEPLSRKISRLLDKCNKIMLEYKRECENYQQYEGIGSFVFQLMQLGAAMEEFGLEHPDFDGRQEWSDFYLELRHFLNMYDILDENFQIYTTHTEDGRFQLKLLCVDPSRVISERTAKAVSTIFFSATLLPIQYYKKMLSVVEDDYAVYAKSTFLPEQRFLAVARDVSSKYTRRGATEYGRIADYMHHLAESRVGNYLVFFPSYRFLEEVLELFQQKYEGSCELLIQERGMREEEKEEFLQKFNDVSEKSMLALTVMGGIFAEGIDLAGEKLIGTMIVGTGLPQMNYERDIIKHFFDIRGENGFDYSYRYPGMNKVEQAAGRVIRTSSDKGVILLLDERFLQKTYLNMFPREWEQYEVVTAESLSAKLDQFWK